MKYYQRGVRNITVVWQGESPTEHDRACHHRPSGTNKTENTNTHVQCPSQGSLSRTTLDPQECGSGHVIPNPNDENGSSSVSRGWSGRRSSLDRWWHRNREPDEGWSVSLAPPPHPTNQIITPTRPTVSLPRPSPERKVKWEKNIRY